MTLTERIAALRSLDAKRTQGKFVAWAGIWKSLLDESVPDEWPITIDGKPCEGGFPDKSADRLLTAYSDADQRYFTALANEALPIIAELEAERDRLRSDLKQPLIVVGADGKIVPFDYASLRAENAKLREAVGVAREALEELRTDRNDIVYSVDVEEHYIVEKALAALEGL